MSRDWQKYRHDDVDVPSESTVHITLSMSGPPLQDGSEARSVYPAHPPRFTAVLPIRTSAPATHSEIPAHARRFWCGTTATMSAEAPFPVRTTMVAEQESPTFTFGEPPSSHESAVGSAAPIQVEARMKADPEAVMYTSCGRYPPPARPTKAGRKPDYDHATMEDFRRHLGVIDCRNVPAETSSNPSRQMPADVPQTQNHALQDYETQLMLLEQAKRERDLSFKQEFEQRGCYSSSPQPNHISATGKQARWQDQRQLMMMEQQKELLQATQGLEANAQRARIPCNVPVGSRTEYQLQLILLEQQNQFRLMQARMAEEDAKNAEERRLAREQRILDRLAEQARCHPPPPGTF